MFFARIPAFLWYIPGKTGIVDRYETSIALFKLGCTFWLSHLLSSSHFVFALYESDFSHQFEHLESLEGRFLNRYNYCLSLKLWLLSLLTAMTLPLVKWHWHWGRDSFVNMTCTLKNALDPNSGCWCTFGLCALHYCRLYCCKFGVALWSGTFLWAIWRSCDLGDWHESFHV